VSPLKLFAARSGDLTASWNDRQLHSRFDPRVEADRFLDSGPAAARVFVIIGPGLGYLIASIRARYPYASVLALAVHPQLSRNLVEPPNALWTPETGVTPGTFLSHHMTDLATASVAVLEWAPVTASFPSQADSIRTAVSAYLRSSHASLVTQGATGRRWLRNRVFNYLHARRIRPTSADRLIRAVALVTAGPSLERSLPRLTAHRDSIEVWTTGSALEAVIARGIRPDVVVVTDASFYATEHIRAALTDPNAEAPVAAPLCATRGIAGCERLLALSESDTVDRALLGEDTSTPIVPPHGTVTATCALLIRTLTAAPILLIGADFAWEAERSHARPHLSEVYREKDVNRLAPASTRVYEGWRSTERVTDRWTTNESLRAYADWFETEAPQRLAPVYALDPSPVLHAIPDLAPGGIDRLPLRYRGIAWTDIASDERELRASRVRAYLERAKKTAGRASQPATTADLEADHPELTELAVRLCLPDLLRWDRSSGENRSAAWTRVIAAVIEELDSCLEFLA